MRRLVVGACGFVVVGLVGVLDVARGQDALGDGRALDANLQVGSGGRNADGRDFRSELEFRNAIVTGNAPGGASFRGEVGYRAANDFRGALGSNDLYRFELDSVYSSLATRNLNGMGTLESSLGMSVAGQSAGYFGGPLIVNRSGVAASASDLTAQPGAPVRVDVFGRLQGGMHSPSLQILRAVEQPARLGVSSSDLGGDPLVVSASSLLGVKMLGSTNVALDPGSRYSESLGGSVGGLRVEPDSAEEEGEGRGMAEPLTIHQKLVDALRIESSRVGGESLAMPIEGVRPGEVDPGEEVAPEATEDAAGEDGLPASPLEDAFPELDRLRDLLESPLAPGVEGAGDSEVDEGEESEEEDVGGLARRLLRTEVPPIETLDPGTTSARVYREHMVRGGSLLGEARWFAAEERFTAALAIVPGDPLAAAGRVHAQLGAGMFLSASVNLRNLLRAYPEFIAARFDGSLLPRGDRLDTLVGQLRQRSERDTPIARDAGLLTAYLGHQYERPDLVREGFATMSRVESALGVEADPLDEALRGVWLEGGE